MQHDIYYGKILFVESNRCALLHTDGYIDGVGFGQTAADIFLIAPWSTSKLTVSLFFYWVYWAL